MSQNNKITNHSFIFDKIIPFSTIDKTVIDNILTNQSVSELKKNICYLYINLIYIIFNLNNQLNQITILQNKIIDKFNISLELLHIDEIKLICNTYINASDNKLSNYDNILVSIKSNKILNELNSLYVSNDTIKVIISNINKEKTYNTIVNIFPGNGEIINSIVNNKIKFNSLHCYDNDKTNNCVCYLNLLSNNIELENIVTTDILYGNDINKNNDLIICNIPSNLKNIIYANCNPLIKKLKIRGTKAEPLILQLLLQLVNKNGQIILVIPNSLLFSDSAQHIESRKYLINNFNVSKIINIPNKKSILIINNNNITKNDIIINDDNILPYDKINKTTYSLYYNEYKFNKINQVSNTMVKLNKIIDIIPYNQSNNFDHRVLYSYKFNKLNYCLLTDEIMYDYLYLTKDESKYKQQFLNIYVFNLLNSNLNVIVKGKMQNINIDIVNELEIENIDTELQDLFITQYELINNNIKNFNNEISNYKKIKHKFIKNKVNNIAFEKLINICSITTNNNVDKNTIIIKKNSLTAGTISYIKYDKNKVYNDLINYYFINITDQTFDLKYIHNILELLQEELVTYASLNKTTFLSKTYLENIEIPIIEIEKQYELLKNIEKYDTYINKLSNQIDELTKFQQSNLYLST